MSPSAFFSVNSTMLVFFSKQIGPKWLEKIKTILFMFTIIDSLRKRQDYTFIISF